MNRQHFLRLLPVICLLALLMNGCAVKQPVPYPAPTKRSPPATKPSAQPGYPTQPTMPPKSVELPEESTEAYTPKAGPAASLHTSAQEAIDRGNYQQAEMTMERALRIEPRNAHYWYTMAQVKYRQQQYSQTIQFCSKSKSLAGKNTQLISFNDALIQKAQQQLSQ